MLTLLLAAVAHAAPPPALESLSWLVGTWRGGADAVVFEETWHAPLGGAMMGSFRYAEGDTVHLYELMTLTGTELRMKHFDGALAARERRKEVTGFTVAEADANRVVFVAVKEPTRLVYTRAGERLEVRLEKAGRPAETFAFQRVQ